jgi:hypothetical protein
MIYKRHRSYHHTYHIYNLRFLPAMQRWFNNKGWEWWGIPVIPATWEADIGGSTSEAGPGQKHKLLSEK